MNIDATVKKVENEPLDPGGHQTHEIMKVVISFGNEYNFRLFFQVSNNDFGGKFSSDLVDQVCGKRIWVKKCDNFQTVCL